MIGYHVSFHNSSPNERVQMQSLCLAGIPTSSFLTLMWSFALINNQYPEANKTRNSCSVSRVDRAKYHIQIPLPPKIDPSVTMMTVEEKPDVTYSDIGGCKEQIERMREVSQLMAESFSPSCPTCKSNEKESHATVV